MFSLNLTQEVFPEVAKNKASRIDDHTVSTSSTFSKSVILGIDSSSSNNNFEHENLVKSLSTNTKLSMLDQEQIVNTLQQLPIDSKEFLVYASCFGTKLDVFILKHFCSNSSELFSHHCQLLASHGLLLKCNILNDDDCFWKFPNQMIVNAAYDMIPLAEQNTFHYKIGRKLWQQLTLNEMDQYIFVLVDQLLRGIDIIKEKGDINENAAVAKLLLRAGERSVQSSDFVNASLYLVHGISLLDDHSWRNEYKLCLNIYNAAAEVAYCSGDFDRANSLVEVTLVHSQLFEDKIQAYTTKIFSLGTTGNFVAAIETGIFVLSKLDEKLPIRPSKIRLLSEVVRIKRKLRSMSDDQLLCLPILQNSKIESIMKVLNAMFSFALVDTMLLGALIGLRMLHLTILHGQSAMSPLGFILYGTILCDWNIDEGFRFGRLGYQMFQRHNVTQWTGRVYVMYFGLIHSLKMPLQEAVVNLKYGYKIALQKGDVEYAFLCGIMYFYGQYEIVTLDNMKADLIEIRQQMSIYHQEHSFAMTTLMETFLKFVRGEEKPDGTRFDPTLIDDNAFQFEEIVMETLRPWTYCDLMMIDYLFGNIERAYRQVKILQAYITKTPSPLMKNKLAFVLFYVGLVSIENYRQYRSGLRYAKKCLKMIQFFTKHAPCNNLGKQYLLEAELESVTRNDLAVALVKYMSATAVTKESKYLTEMALSNERTAKFLLSKGEIERAEPFYTNAILHYHEWGSEPKVKHLQNEIGFHFSSSRINVMEESWKQNKT